MPASVRKGLILIWLGALSVAAVLLAIRPASSAQEVAKPGNVSFDEITVQRLNVVEPDGKPRVVVSSRKRMPGLYWGGKEYKHYSRDEGGFLFFNDDGDEVGGMIFRSRSQGDQSSAGSSLLFDQYKQGETLGLIYSEQNRQREAGLRVWDQPNESIFPAIELSDKIMRASSDAERAALKAQMKEMEQSLKSKGYFTERFFVGKQLDASLVKLADKQGHTRLVLKVDPQGEASIEFLDAAGKTVRRLGSKE